MTWYQSITAAQSPFEGPNDDQGRPTVTFNLNLVKRRGRGTVREVVRVLQDAGLGTFNETIFGGSEATLPADTDTDVPFITVQETGGAGPLPNQDDALAYVRPSVKIVVHASAYEDAQALAHDAFEALAGIRNRDIGAV